MVKMVFDIDSTLSATMPAVLETYHRVWGKRLPIPTTWNVADAWPHLSAEEHQWLDAAYCSPFTAANALPLPNSTASVTRARERGYDVLFRSHRPAEQTRLTRHWLEHYGYLEQGAPDGLLACGSGAKVKFVNDHPFARIIFLDDSPRDLWNLYTAATQQSEDTSRLTLCCLSQPWNERMELPPIAIRFLDHREFAEWISDPAVIYRTGRAA